MLMRLMFALLLLVLHASIAGCATAPAASGDPQEHLALLAQHEGVEVVTEGVIFEPDQEYRFRTPVQLRLRHPCPHNPRETSDFIAIAAPLEPGGEYWLSFVLAPTPLLVVRDGVVYAAGTRPAVGGDQVGTHGDGTTVILESREGFEYVYLLEGGSAVQFRRETPQVSFHELTNIGTFAAYRWGAETAPEPEPIDEDEMRRTIRNRMLVLAGLLPQEQPGE